MPNDHLAHGAQAMVIRHEVIQTSHGEQAPCEGIGSGGLGAAKLLYLKRLSCVRGRPWSEVFQQPVRVRAEFSSVSIY